MKTNWLTDWLTARKSHISPKNPSLPSNWNFNWWWDRQLIGESVVGWGDWWKLGVGVRSGVRGWWETGLVGGSVSGISGSGGWWEKRVVWERCERRMSGRGEKGETKSWQENNELNNTFKALISFFKVVIVFSAETALSWRETRKRM